MTTTELAKAFCAALAQVLSSQQLSAIRQRNSDEADLSICHTHDFCDANQVMLDAYARFGAELDIADSHCMAAVDEAWWKARRAGFVAEEVSE